MNVEKLIQSQEEYNLLKLLVANTNKERLWFESLHLDHKRKRVVVSNSYALLVVELSGEWWQRIFSDYPERVFVTKLRRDIVCASEMEELHDRSFAPIFDPVGTEPFYKQVFRMDCEYLTNLIAPFEKVDFIKYSGTTLFTKLTGGKLPEGKYIGALAPVSITDDVQKEVLKELLGMKETKEKAEQPAQSDEPAIVEDQDDEADEMEVTEEIETADEF